MGTELLNEGVGQSHNRTIRGHPMQKKRNPQSDKLS